MANLSIEKDIDKAKKTLISKAKSKGIYENFGQKEVRQLEDKYGYNNQIQAFDNWCMNFDMSQISRYAKGGSIKDIDIQVGKEFILANDEKIKIIRLFDDKNSPEHDWVEFEFRGENKENSVKSLRIFINNWRKKYAEGGNLENNFEAIYNRQKIQLKGTSLWDAKQKAIQRLNVPKSKQGLLSVYSIGSSENQDFRYYAEGGAVRGGLFQVGDKVMVKDSGYMTSFDGFNISEPATIISKSKSKAFGKVVYFYGIETADGQRPYNKAYEKNLTLVDKMAKGGKLQYKDIEAREISDKPLMERYKKLKEECQISVGKAWQDSQKGVESVMSDFIDDLDAELKKHFNVIGKDGYWHYKSKLTNKITSEVFILSKQEFYGDGSRRPKIIIFGGTYPEQRRDVLLSEDLTAKEIVGKILKFKNHIVNFTDKGILVSKMAKGGNIIKSEIGNITTTGFNYEIGGL